MPVCFTVSITIHIITIHRAVGIPVTVDHRMKLYIARWLVSVIIKNIISRCIYLVCTNINNILDFENTEKHVFLPLDAEKK